ncbi:gliding motility-associated C-terminal domain-containing protein [Polluticoccus soli]|uniref:T9SS type B sorting domain-containing protein n=1 Tax=Polluticoccus soli TaxID=3034150 RepID=UPI0023E34C73|nr:gliding motility-associated C-terminal domain-containing protein [Flavipsychrobacter sp. JY13-12]
MPAIVFAQSPVSLLHTGGSQNDEGRLIRLAPNGNIILAGYFHDTIDLDPGPSAYELISNDHSRDIFLASYTQTGKLNWAFSIGSEQADGVLDMTIAPNNDIYIAGYFKDKMDFDPSSDTAEVPCLGYTGTTTDEYGGDGFVAKYSSAGAFYWVVPIQSDYGEEVESVALDAEGNVYIGGQFKNLVDFDPSPSATATFNSVNDGTAFLAKYTTNGQYQWAHTFGKPGITMTDNLIRAIAIDAQSNLYVAGVFQGVNNDFDPSPANAATLSASGKYDALVAKYDKDGNYLWAINIQSESTDDALDIKLDKSGHLYVCGNVYGDTVDFDPRTTAGIQTLANSNGNPNIFIAKYDLNGNYIWGKVMGSVGMDMSWSLRVSGEYIYNTGFFSGPLDLNPNASPVEVNSKGLMDLYLVKYDSAGNYKCHLTIGSSDNDVGRDVLISPVGDLYLTGGYSNDADFDISQNEKKIAANGKEDILFAKYKWDCAREGLPLKDTVVVACDTPYILEEVSMFETGVYGVFRGDTAIVVDLTIASPLLRPAFSNSKPLENEPVHFTNESKGALAQTWDFGDGSTSEEADPEHMYLKSGSYKVCLTIYNEVCTAKVCHAVDAIAEPAVGVPTGFSPNGDGKNDILYVRGGAVKTIHLVLYNRWGQKIFETNDINQGWDGTYDGQQQGLDAVGYLLNAVMLDGREVHQSGNVTIIR